MKGKMRKSPLDNAQPAPTFGVDFTAIDALFKRIAERGRKVRTQAQSQESGDKEQSSILPKHMHDDKNTKQVDE